MPTYEHLQSNFSGGEVSLLLRGRVDSDLYRRALAYAENWEPVSQGAARTRPGTRLRAVLPDAIGASASCRNIPFHTAQGTDYVVALGDKSLRVFASDASPVTVASGGNSVLFSGATELVTNGDFSGGGSNTVGTVGGWTTFQDAGRGNWSQRPEPASFDAYPAACQLKEVAYAVAGFWFDSGRAGIKQTITVPAGANQTLTVRLSLAGKEPWFGKGGGTLGTEAAVSPCSLRLGTTDGGGEILDWVASYAECQGALGAPPIVVGTIANVAPGTYHLTIATAQKTREGRTAPNGSAPIIDNVSIIASTATTTTGGAGAGRVLPTPWAASDLAAIQYVADPLANRLILVHPSAPPQSLQLASDGTWLFTAPDFTGAPDSWAAGSYPAAVELFQSRLWLAYGSSLVASKPGVILDLRLSDPGSPPTDGDGISATLATKGAIRWMHGRQALLLGTDVGEYSVTAQNGVVSPIDMQVTQESAFGSAPIQAIDLGDQVVYLSRDRRKVRALSYSREANSWISRDLTYAAEHLTEPGIREVHFARDPDLTLCLVLSDGTMACCTYDRAAEVAAWWRFTTAGTVLSAAVTNDDTGSIMWLAVRRQYQAESSAIFLETFALADDAPRLDASLTLPVPGDRALRGLGHFVGQSLSVLLDGVVLGLLPVAQDDGTVLLPGQPGGVVPDGTPWTASGIWPFAYVSAGSLWTYNGHTYQALVTGFIPGPGTAMWLDLGVTGSVLPATDPVYSGGMLDVGAAGVLATVGLPFPAAKLQLLPPEGGNPRGTSQRAKRRWVKAVLRLNASAMPLVNGERAPERRPADPMDTAVPPFTGDVAVDVTSGWDDQGVLTIEQDLPLRTEVLAVFGSIALGEL